MAAVLRGEVVRFDQVKGYGFISPKGGGEDVFLHANDLLDEKHLVRPGATVEFIVESGEKGLKACSVHVVSPAPEWKPGPAEMATVPAHPVGTGPLLASVAHTDLELDEGLVDVLTEADFAREVTELLLLAEPTLTGAQVLAIRRALAQLASRYGWIGG